MNLSCTFNDNIVGSIDIHQADLFWYAFHLHDFDCFVEQPDFQVRQVGLQRDTRNHFRRVPSFRCVRASNRWIPICQLFLNYLIVKRSKIIGPRRNESQFFIMVSKLGTYLLKKNNQHPACLLLAPSRWIFCASEKDEEYHLARL